MRSLLLAIMAFFVLCAVGALIPLPRDASDAVDLAWPADAAGWRTRRGKGTSPTNGELIKRGLRPSRPRKLYQPKSRSPEKRLLDAPTGAQASGSPNLYTRQGCYSGVNGGQPNSRQIPVLGIPNVQDLVNRCAAEQDKVTVPGTASSCAVLRYGTENGNCLIYHTGATAQSVACTRGNYAIYAS